MDDHDIDQRERHHLCAEFAILLTKLGNLLEKCTKVDTLRTFLQLYCHPLYPEKLYIETRIVCNAKTASDIIFGLLPTYINFMDHYLLQEIVNRFGNEECRHHYQEYQGIFQKFVKRLRHHPAPVTDDDIEQCTRQKRLKVSVKGDANKTTPQNVQAVKGAIRQASGIGQAGLVLANQGPGNSVIFNFLIPYSCVELFRELSDNGLTMLATAGITKVQVEDMEIAVIKKHSIKRNRVKGSSSFTAQITGEPVKPTSLEYYLNQRQNISSQECHHLIAMVKMISDTQLNQACSKELLLEFSSCIYDWRALAPFLGVSDIFYDDLTTRFPTIAEQSYQLFLYWKRMEGKDAIYRHLLETVILHGSTEEVRTLVHILLKG